MNEAVKRLLPESLFARMVLVLLAGLVVAQLLSFAVHWRERGEFISRSIGLRSAQRIGDIVRLLDTVEPSERAKLVSVLSSPPLRISLDVPPLAPAPDDPEKEEQAAQFAAVVQRAAGEDYPLVVQASDAVRRGRRRMEGGGDMSEFGGQERGGSERGGPDRGGLERGGLDRGGSDRGGPERGMRRFPGVSFVVQARLHDSTLITFDSRQPAESVNWPYRLLLSLVVLLAAVIAVTLFAVRWVTQPLKTLAQAAQSLGENINRPPIDESGPLEVSRAAHAFNAMQQKLSRFISERTQTFTAMSHDLKTPITRLRLRAEMLDDGELRAKFVKDLEEMEAMVSAALDFMRGVEQQGPAQPIDIMALLESLQEDAREVGGDVRIEGTVQSSFAGHAQTLKRCLGNLIDNAVNYGQRAQIVIADTAGELAITVRDEGPGMPEAELERAFEPFYRLEASRNRATGGSGLGLTIARNIARAHGGDLVLRNRAGGGLEAALTLPRRG